MSTLKISGEKNAEGKIDQLLKEVKQLKIPDLEGFLTKALKILERRKSPEYKKREEVLIDKIQNGGPSEKVILRQKKLIEKSIKTRLTPSEHQEALKLIPIFDQWTFKRLKLLNELAELRESTVEETMKNLKIESAQTIYA